MGESLIAGLARLGLLAPLLPGWRAALALALLLCAHTGHACDCFSAPLAERVKLSSEVFVAEVLAHKPLVSVQLRVLESFKGSSRGKLTVVLGPADCDYFLPPVNPRPGNQFLIFMSRTAGKHTVSRCLGSGPLSSSRSDVATLRQRSLE